MKTKIKLCRMAVIAILSLITLQVAIAEEQTMSTLIKDVFNENLNSCQQENMEAMLDTVHSQSPSYLMSKQQMSTIFENFDLNYELTYYKYIGQDNDYAVARARFTSKKISGSAFQDNEVDSIQIFKKEDGVWKIWSAAILDVKYL